MASQSSAQITPSARRVLAALVAKGEATYNELLIRTRPISDEGLTRSVLELERKGLVYLSKHDGLAWATDLGREALRS
jgi:hypothetical protein